MLITFVLVHGILQTYSPAKKKNKQQKGKYILVFCTHPSTATELSQQKENTKFNNKFATPYLMFEGIKDKLFFLRYHHKSRN